MNQGLAHVALVVRDYDEAIAFYVDRLGFDLVEDTPRPEREKRWVVVRPRGEGACSLLLARASTPRQARCIGDQSGGRVFLFLRTDDFWRDYQAFVERQVAFEREPEVAEYGIVAVFRDLYGNLWVSSSSPTAGPETRLRAHGRVPSPRRPRSRCRPSTRSPSRSAPSGRIERRGEIVGKRGGAGKT